MSRRWIARWSALALTTVMLAAGCAQRVEHVASVEDMAKAIGCKDLGYPSGTIMIEGMAFCYLDDAKINLYQYDNAGYMDGIMDDSDASASWTDACVTFAQNGSNFAACPSDTRLLSRLRGRLPAG